MQQPPRFDLIADRRAIIDRRAVTERLRRCPTADLQRRRPAILKAALDAGRAEIARRLAAEPARGRVIAASYAFLSDQLVRLAYDLVVQRSIRSPTPRRASACRSSGWAAPGAARWRPTATWT